MSNECAVIENASFLCRSQRPIFRMKFPTWLYISKFTTVWSRGFSATARLLLRIPRLGWLQEIGIANGPSDKQNILQSSINRDW